jgi:hypothetical protein
MRLVRTFGLPAGSAMVGSMAFAGGASAKPIEHRDFHDEFTEIIPNFCEVSGLTVKLDSVLDGRFLLNLHGPDRLPYVHENVRFTDIFTNQANPYGPVSAQLRGTEAACVRPRACPYVRAPHAYWGLATTKNS